MQEIVDFAATKKIKPATVLQYSLNMSGGTWAKWLDGTSCSMATAEKVRRYMAAETDKNGTKG